ncbi:MAG: tail fiber domain-containing protein, partial [Flavobacteriales bacterium]|nr:tail fiber domain-containing protein [Flavobacteriales bacterium]
NSFAISSVAGVTDNFAIVAEASGASSSNIGIRATASGAGARAAEFNGIVFINGDIDGAGNFLYFSDQNIKTNIDQISNADIIIEDLSPVSFYFDTVNCEQLNLSSQKQYGLIAQDVEQILPELVSEVIVPATFDTLGNVIYQPKTVKTLNYNAFIGLLIAGMQEQQQEIDSLKAVNQNLDSLFAQVQQIQNCINNLPAGMGCTPVLRQSENGDLISEEQREAIEVTLSDPRTIVLDQNTPNPFREQTTVSWFIPETVGEAKIIFLNNNGTVIKEVVIDERGYGSMNVYAYDLSTGIYNYSLVADGELIETKKMMRVK